MKLLRNLSLKQLAVISGIALVLLFSIEMMVWQLLLSGREALHHQLDYIRSSQMQVQELNNLAVKVTEDITLRPRMIAIMRQQEYALNRMQTGGDIPGTDLQLNPLSRLPKITHSYLLTEWSVYKAQLDTYIKSPDSESLVELEGQGLLVSDLYQKLITDIYQQIEIARQRYQYFLLACILINVGAVGAMIWLFIQHIIKPLRAIEWNTSKHNHTRNLPQHEIGAVATQINEVIEQFRDATDFVKSIGSGKLDIDYRNELDSNYTAGHNQLADSLIDMQQQLRKIKEEDERRKWANEGLSKFVDILRSSDNIQKLGDKIVSTLVQYTRSNQGSLYIFHEEDDKRYLELISLYAFSVKKFEKRIIKPGEGLLGQAFLERDTIYLKEIPQDYIRITSGLGETNPATLLIVPLKLENDVYGVVELASFTEYQPHEIAFVEKLGETIASTLASVKAAENNKRLLQESKMAEEAMRAQEEEMRQNMEELTATQEEMQRVLREAQNKEAYLSNLMNATTDAFVAIDRDYRVVMRNNAPLFDQFIASGIRYEPGFNVLSLYKHEELQHHKSLYDRTFEGEKTEVIKEYYGKKYEITYSPLRSNAGDIIGLAIFAHDLTDELTLHNRIKELETKLAETPKTSTEDLAGAEQMLKVNIEAFRIAREELGKR